MCNFKPGDEVVCIRNDFREPAPAWMFWTLTQPAKKGLRKGAVYVVKDVTIEVFLNDPPAPFVSLKGIGGGWSAHSFRKVQRRDLSAWLKTATKFEEPKRVGVSA